MHAKFQAPSLKRLWGGPLAKFSNYDGKTKQKKVRQATVQVKSQQTSCAGWWSRWRSSWGWAPASPWSQGTASRRGPEIPHTPHTHSPRPSCSPADTPVTHQHICFQGRTVNVRNRKAPGLSKFRHFITKNHDVFYFNPGMTIRKLKEEIVISHQFSCKHNVNVDILPP